MTDPEVEQTAIDLPQGLSQPARRALLAAGCRSLAQVATWSEREMLALHGVGPHAIKVLRPALQARGLAFAEGDARGGASPTRA